MLTGARSPGAGMCRLFHPGPSCYHAILGGLEIWHSYGFTSGNIRTRITGLSMGRIFVLRRYCYRSVAGQKNFGINRIFGNF